MLISSSCGGVAIFNTPNIHRSSLTRKCTICSTGRTVTTGPDKGYAMLKCLMLMLIVTNVLVLAAPGLDRWISWKAAPLHL
ncbi:MAG: hypothetical protein HNEKOMLI_00641 [Sodalis sp. Psp]|nr:hypothetical protein [Sodalis sp. Psp]MCR3757108.1 hypothetical protein [Sodalis sp. Ppy]